MPTYGANKAGHVVDDAAGEVEGDVRLDGHEVEDDLPGEARHVARLPRYHCEEGRLARQHLEGEQSTQAEMLVKPHNLTLSSFNLAIWNWL
jgi:hypothetical protein